MTDTEARLLSDRRAPDTALVSPTDWRRPTVRYGLGAAHLTLLVLLVVGCLGPLLWLAKAAITPTNDTLTTPMAFFSHGFAWSNLSKAWTDVRVGRYFWNTVVLAFGSWMCQMLVATTGGFALSVLRPRYARVVSGLLLTTLFVPAVVLLVPLYIEIVHPPVINHSFVNSYWAVWLPAGASAFNVVLMKRFFDNLPREIFDAARVDGAGAFRLFFSITLPMSRPIIGVVSVFAVLASWKDFLWPLLVLSEPNIQPLSVRLPSIQAQTELGVFLAALFIATIGPIIGFLIFQRSFLRGSGLSGAVKG
ncbi:MAG: multiple sugar transport system permease protein [Pseudonocardiales bacterium]|jgi:multiple sugar transport system permease protein|nr:multiple sugar transport system permease protein [Pseudonocardiales bacterium]MDT4959568.1 multiple sugar transport system permease protein [Pseudonocardiales bacterium]MDT4960473.1 multiple sugar transport system permease protein [Pseudonocardiales bacterium]MDT4975249.1 multiple sugar transport system permease protein [Pseudonocardiales bacterium]MDT4978963.1 multiple sugar transport system permease protein [Pseudonocardiales bacterium]